MQFDFQNIRSLKQREFDWEKEEDSSILFSIIKILPLYSQSKLEEIPKIDESWKKLGVRKSSNF